MTSSLIVQLSVLLGMFIIPKEELCMCICVCVCMCVWLAFFRLFSFILPQPNAWYKLFGWDRWNEKKERKKEKKRKEKKRKNDYLSHLIIISIFQRSTLIYKIE